MNLWLVQEPVCCFVLYGMPETLCEIISTYTAVNEVVNVACLISSCEQVIQPPEIDVAILSSTEAFILVIIFANCS